MKTSSETVINFSLLGPSNFVIFHDIMSIFVKSILNCYLIHLVEVYSYHVIQVVLPIVAMFSSLDSVLEFVNVTVMITVHIFRSGGREIDSCS